MAGAQRGAQHIGYLLLDLPSLFILGLNLLELAEYRLNMILGLRMVTQQKVNMLIDFPNPRTFLWPGQFPQSFPLIPLILDLLLLPVHIILLKEIPKTRVRGLTGLRRPSAIQRDLLFRRFCVGVLADGPVEACGAIGEDVSLGLQRDFDDLVPHFELLGLAALLLHYLVQFPHQLLHVFLAGHASNRDR